MRPALQSELEEMISVIIDKRTYTTEYWSDFEDTYGPYYVTKTVYAHKEGKRKNTKKRFKQLRRELRGQHIEGPLQIRINQCLRTINKDRKNAFLRGLVKPILLSAASLIIIGTAYKIKGCRAEIKEGYMQNIPAAQLIELDLNEKDRLEDLIKKLKTSLEHANIPNRYNLKGYIPNKYNLRAYVREMERDGEFITMNDLICYHKYNRRLAEVNKRLRIAEQKIQYNLEQGFLRGYADYEDYKRLYGDKSQWKQREN